ncbi:MAG: exonuclease SbcCD subunit D [Oscillospiraceae bacterium]|nr:exonuclease SbcCD subunit D [Oscillospiraceae bacterium]
MRFFHLADLHFGKMIHGVSLLENGDQGYWVDQFLKLAEEQKPDAVVIAGDVYDRSAPSGDAVLLLSRMVTALSELQIPVMMTAGNHDSAQRLSFAGPMLARQGLHISAPLFASPELEHVTLEDEYGPVTFWLMPYVFPTLIAQALGEETPRDNDGAVRALLERQALDPSSRNVLVAHQNVTVGGAEAVRGGSETMVGGVGQIDYTAFDAFDYVALGHIHAACSVGRETVRYAGSPLCYHFNEIRQPAKGPLLVELGAKGQMVRTERFPLAPLHPMRELRGACSELRERELAVVRKGEYLRLVLTDCRLSPEITSFFDDLARERGSILMDRCSEYNPFAADAGAPSSHAVEQKSVSELFGDFYGERSGGELPPDEDLAFLRFAQELSQHADPHEAPGTVEIERLLQYLLEQEGNV